MCVCVYIYIYIYIYTYNLIAKFRLKLKKVGKTTRPFRYDLYQIPYDYTVEVQGAVAARVQESQEDLLHIQGQEGRL